MDADVPAAPDTDLAATPAPTTPAAGGVAEVDGAATSSAPPALDLDSITADLEGVEVALTRLSDGAYWTDEVTGEPLPDDLLAASPTARRA